MHSVQKIYFISFLFFINLIKPDASVTIPISHGELIDKITILEIKSEKITDTQKLKNIIFELQLLCDIIEQNPLLQSYYVQELKNNLKTVNNLLWIVEDMIREEESKKTFGKTFVYLARCVYHINDIRGQLKRLINEACHSPLIEEKSYTEYK